MGYHKEMLIEVCEAVEKETGIDFDIIQDHIMDDNVKWIGSWCFSKISDKWFGFSDKQINPVKIVFGNTLAEVKKLSKSK